MKLHWSPRSPYVRKVTIAIIELGLESRVERVRSPVAITALNDAVMQDNPLNKIPTLVRDDGSPLYDSFVICSYLDTLVPSPRLIPTDAALRIETLRMHALANGFIDALILWRNERDRPDGERSQRHLDAYATKTKAVLGQLDAVEVDKLAQTPFDLAHITLGAALGYIDFRFPDLGWRTARPSLTQWFETFSARPSAISTEPAE